MSINSATPQDTLDHTIGAGATSWSWYIGTAKEYYGDWPTGDTPDDWSVTLVMENPLEDGTVRVELTHKAVMSAARYVIGNADKTWQYRPEGRVYMAFSGDLIRECRNLIFSADEADLDAVVADELIQVVAFRTVHFG